MQEAETNMWPRVPYCSGNCRLEGQFGRENRNRELMVYPIWQKDAYYCQQVFLQLTQLTGWKGLSRQCVSAHWICESPSALLGPPREATRTAKHALTPPSERMTQKSLIRSFGGFHMVFTYEINSVTTKQVDVLDTANHVSTACHGAEEDGVTVENGTL